MSMSDIHGGHLLWKTMKINWILLTGKTKVSHTGMPISFFQKPIFRIEALYPLQLNNHLAVEERADCSA